MVLRLVCSMLLVSSAPIFAMNIGTFSQERKNSDIMTITLTDVDSTHPECTGHKEAIADIYDRRLQRSFPHARGCWFDQIDGYIPVHLWTFSGGDEFTASIGLNDIQFTPEYKATAGKHDQGGETADKASSISTEQLIEDAVLFGSCAVIFHADKIAQTAQEKAFAAKLRARVAEDGKVEPEEVDQQCRAAIERTVHVVKDSEKAQ